MNATYQWEEPLHRLPRLMLWFLGLVVVCALFWAAVAQVRVSAIVHGTLAPRVQPLQLNTPIAGRVVMSQVQLWQRVKKGDLLLTVDAVGRDSRDAALQLSIQQNLATQARQEIAQAKIDLSEKQRHESSARKLYAIGGLASADLETATAAAKSASATLAQARMKLSSAQAQLKLLNLNQHVRIYSPIDGQIMQLSDVHVGQTLGSGQNVLAILPAGVPLVFNGSADERDRPKLRPSAQVQIAWNGYPRQKYGVSIGVLHGISPTSEVTSSGTVSYQVEVQLPQNSLSIKDRPLLPGMVGEAQVMSGKRTVLQLFWDWVRGADPWS